MKINCYTHIQKTIILKGERMYAIKISIKNQTKYDLDLVQKIEITSYYHDNQLVPTWTGKLDNPLKAGTKTGAQFTVDEDMESFLMQYKQKSKATYYLIGLKRSEKGKWTFTKSEDVECDIQVSLNKKVITCYFTIEKI